MPSESRLYIVGIGPGGRGLLTRRAKEALLEARSVVGYGPYLNLVKDLLPGKVVRSTGMGREVERAREAVDLLAEGDVALISSGDPNVYGMAGLGLEVASGRVELERVEVVPGITSFSAAASRAGITFREAVAVISLSDLLTPWERIEDRARAASELGMPMAIYNPRSRRRTWQLERLLDIVTGGGEGDRHLLVAKNVSRPGEALWWTTAGEVLEREDLREEIDMFTLLIIGGEGMAEGWRWDGRNEKGDGRGGEGMGKAEGGRGVEGIAAGGPIAEATIRLVGVGPGDPRHLTLEAEGLIRGSDLLLGAERHLASVGALPGGLGARSLSISPTGRFEERVGARLAAAEDAAGRGETASILFGGDPGTFSSAWRGLSRPGIRVSPGVGAFAAAAARVGAPLVNDFALLSGLDGEAPEKARRLLEAGFAVVFYNQSSGGLKAIAEAASSLDPERPFALVQDATRPDERIAIGRASDLARPKFDGRRCTLILPGPEAHLREGRIIARRGYERKYDY